MMENPDWEELYNAAMASCRTMILLITRQWLTSKYCWMEMDTLVSMAEKKNAPAKTDAKRPITVRPTLVAMPAPLHGKREAEARLCWSQLQPAR